jgi:hypothetical protein
MSFDLIRMTSTTTGTGPFTLVAAAGFGAFSSRYAVGAPIFVGLQGLDTRGVPVAQRIVGVGQLLSDGRLQVDSITTGSNGATPVAFTAATIVIVDVMSVAAVRDLALGIALTGDVTKSAGSSVTTLADLVVTDAKVATANKDGATNVPSMRTIGTGALQAAAGTSIATHVAAANPHEQYAARGAGRGPVEANSWGMPGEWVPVFATAISSAIGADNRLVFFGFTAHENIIITGILVNVSVASAAGGVGQMSMYNAVQIGQVGYTPTTKIADAGSTVAIDSTGAKSITGLSFALVKGGNYAFAFSVSRTCSLVRFPLRSPAAHGYQGTSTSPIGLLQQHIETSHPPPASLAGASIVQNFQSGVPDYTTIVARWTAP